MTQSKFLLILNTGNDADIIKESILHNEKFFDKIIVSDRNSIDSTLDIIESLGLSKIEIIQDGNYFWKTQCDVHLKHMQNNPEFDFTFILDADEFIIAENLEELNNIPSGFSPIAKWKTYVPVQEVKYNFITNFKYRRESEPFPSFCHKVVHIKTLNGKNTNGNHQLLDKNNNDFPYIDLKTLKLAHFPVRSIEQYNRKVNYFNSTFYELTQSFYGRTKTINTLEELVYCALNYVNEYEPKGIKDIVYDPI